MASVYWRRGYAYAKVQRNNRTFRRSLKTKDAAVADAELARFVKEIDAAHSSVPEAVQWTVREAIDKFTEDHLPTLKPKAIRRYYTSSRWVLPFFGEMVLSEVSSKDLYAFEQWRKKMRYRGRKISSTTIKRDLAYLSSIFTAAETWEWTRYNPVKPFLKGRKAVGAIVEGPPRERYLTHAEEEQLLTAPLPEDHDPLVVQMLRDAIIFALETGLRAEEQWSLKKEDFNWAARRVRVRAEVSKTGKARWVPLRDRAWAIAQRLRASNRSEYMFWRYDGERVEHTWAYREFQKLVKAAKLQDVEWHDLRRTCGCRLLQDHGMSMELVSRWLGHSNTKVTEKHYAFLRVEDLEKAIKPGVA